MVDRSGQVHGPSLSRRASFRAGFGHLSSPALTLAETFGRGQPHPRAEGTTVPIEP